MSESLTGWAIDSFFFFSFLVELTLSLRFACKTVKQTIKPSNFLLIASHWSAVGVIHLWLELYLHSFSSFCSQSIIPSRTLKWLTATTSLTQLSWPLQIWFLYCVKLLTSVFRWNSIELILISESLLVLCDDSWSYKKQLHVVEHQKCVTKCRSVWWSGIKHSGPLWLSQTW